MHTPALNTIVVGDNADEPTEKKQLLELIYHHCTDLLGLFYCADGEEFILRSVNRTTLETAARIGLQLEPAQLIGASLSTILRDVLSQSPGEIVNKLAEYRRTVATGTPLQTELTVTVNGVRHLYEELLIPILTDDRSTRPKYVLWSARDITTKRQAQERERQLERQLQESQKLESLGLLAGGIAHDFNNLLTAIMNHTGVALTEIAATHPVHRHLELIQTSARIAAGLTRELLAYSGKGTILNQPLSVNQLIDEMLPLLQTSLPINAKLSFVRGDDAPTIQADVNQLRQVLLNLVINAGEALQENTGSIVIATRRANPTVMNLDWQLPIPLPNEALLLEVRDSGCGIDQAAKRRIFDPFYTTKSAGRGLGLSAVIGIIRAHLGNLAVSSTSGQGTTFHIVLPSDPSVNPKIALAGTPLVASRDAGATILVIDDLELVRNSVSAVLTVNGHSVRSAAGGAEGIEIFRRHAADINLVIIDMTMPGLTGEEVFIELRKIVPDIRVILTTGHSIEDISRRLLTLPRVGFVQKAGGPESLILEVRKLLAK